VCHPEPTKPQNRLETFLIMKMVQVRKLEYEGKALVTPCLPLLCIKRMRNLIGLCKTINFNALAFVKIIVDLGLIIFLTFSIAWYTEKHNVSKLHLFPSIVVSPSVHMGTETDALGGTAWR
jgi:hypothetical protein